MSSADLALFTPFNLRGFLLRNRIVMAPLSRNQAHLTGVPDKDNISYYEERTAAGLMIAESTQISPTAKALPFSPGIYSQEQIKGWKLITDAVHAKGGIIFLQISHAGRLSHYSLQPGNALPCAPSAIAPMLQYTILTNGQIVKIGKPRVLEVKEINAIVKDFRKAAQNAMTAGFDGVEIQAANGLLIHQFLADGANHRRDIYGGSVTNRVRFALEVTDAMIAEIGENRTGIRISPTSTNNGIFDSSPGAVFFPLVSELNKRKVAYIHAIEGEPGGSRVFHGYNFSFEELRKEFNGAWIANNGYSKQMATKAIASGYADLISFGRLFMTNPQLVKCFKKSQLLKPIDADNLYISI